MQQLWRGLVVLFVLGCWWQLLASKRAFSSGYSAHNVASTRSTHQQLRLPTTLHASWTLGRCAARVESTDHLEVSKALKEVSGILKAPGVTPDAVVRIGLALKEQDARPTFSAQIRDGLTLSNVVWVIGIIGITFSVYPALLIMVPPLWRRFRPYLEALYRPLLQYAQPCSEVAAILAAYLLVRMAAHADNVHSTRASLTAMSGCLVVLPALWHAHGTGSTNMAWWRAEQLYSLFVVAYSTPVAIYHNSQLIGVLTCAALFVGLRVTLIHQIVKLFRVGKSRECGMWRSRAASGLLMAWPACSQLAGVHLAVLKPFDTGLLVFGAITFGIAGGYATSKYCYGGQHRRRYAISNATFALQLGIGLLLAVRLRLPNMLGTMLACLLAWTLIKLIESAPRKAAWPLVLMFSLCIWCSAYWQQGLQRTLMLIKHW